MTLIFADLPNVFASTGSSKFSSFCNKTIVPTPIRNKMSENGLKKIVAEAAALEKELEIMTNAHTLADAGTAYVLRRIRTCASPAPLSELTVHRTDTNPQPLPTYTTSNHQTYRMYTFIQETPDAFAGVTKDGEPNPWMQSGDGGCVVS